MDGKELKPINVYVVGNMKNYANFIYGAVLVDKLADAKIVMFTGGEDVCPKLYGEKTEPGTYFNIERDMYETEMFKKIKKDQLVIGVCRGSQFLCVMNGGKLIQDVTNHALWGTHMISNGSTIVDITSTHHQMQYPFNLNDEDYDILFASRENQSDHYYGGGIDTRKMACEPEIVLYHKEKLPVCLAIQGHPEIMRKDSPAVIEINKIITNLL